eukprot:2823395-Pleurochrysis_carterae.AAC.1
MLSREGRRRKRRKSLSSSVREGSGTRSQAKDCACLPPRSLRDCPRAPQCIRSAAGRPRYRPGD